MKTKICSQSNMCVNVANWTHSVRETLHRGDWQDQLISVSHGGSMTTVIWRWLIAEQHGNVYSHLPSDSHTHPASIKPTVRPHPIIPEPASSLTSHYKTLRHLGEGELHSFMNRFVLVCSFLLQMEALQAQDPVIAPAVIVPESRVKSISSWQLSSY